MMSSSMASLERGRTRRQSPNRTSETAESECPSRLGHNRRDLMERQGAQRHLYLHPNDHCGDKSVYEDTYSFWTSKPALAAFSFLLMAIVVRRIQFLYGSLAIFTYEVILVLSKWSGFIVHHPKLEECKELTKFWVRFSLRQAEQFMDPKDRLRKTALGAFYMNYTLTSKLAGGYFHARKVESVKRALEEGHRLQSRHCVTATTA